MPRHLLTLFMSIAISMCSLAGMAAGQVGTLQQRLAKTTALSCTFSVKATGAWTDGGPAADVASASIRVAFTNVNVDEGTADIEGTYGTTFIVVRYSNRYLHLIQMQDAGPLYTTSVLAKQTKDGRLMAIHTRHEYTDVRLPGFTSRPEMYLGECALGDR